MSPLRTISIARILTRKRLVLITGFVLVACIAYYFWAPGLDIRDGRHDLKTNGLWMQHGWLGDDAWFQRNKKDPKLFRDKLRLAPEAKKLQNYHIRDLYPHLCPCSPKGEIAASNPEQVERFLDAFESFRVMPWVGGVNGTDALVSDANWRKIFVQSCASLLSRHPRLAGVHVNVEPLRSGNKDYLLLLDELRKALPQGKLISIAAYPPPTKWQPIAEVHWDESYSREVASKVDQASVMMYDTSLRLPKLYQDLMKDWTMKVLNWYGATEVLLGVPAYNDAGVGYHDPGTENLCNSLLGIHAGLNDPLPSNYHGTSIYCEWEMTPQKWQEFRSEFCESDASK